MTDDMQRAFAQLEAHTFNGGPNVVQYKQRIARHLLASRVLDVNILRDHTTVYVGSHTDIEYPLLIGARKVHLVDPCFADPAKVGRVLQKVETMTRRTAEITGTSIQFEFDFGQGNERVLVRCLAQKYAQQGENIPAAWKYEFSRSRRDEDFGDFFPSEDAVPAYVPTRPIGLLLGFALLGINFDQNRQVMDCLVPGGYILASADPYEELDITLQEFHTLATISLAMQKDQWVTMMQQLYAAEGKYEFLSLKDAPPHEDYYSFLKKL